MVAGVEVHFPPPVDAAVPDLGLSVPMALDGIPARELRTSKEAFEVASSEPPATTNAPYEHGGAVLPRKPP